MSEQVRRSSSTFLRVLSSLLILVLAGYVFLHRQELLDKFTVWQFTPSPEIAAISQRAAFDETGKFLYYASQPELLDRNAFNAACRSAASEQTAILGCYSANRIYLYNVNNQQLDGVKEVTAAHEMLHAAYQRLTRQEKAHVNKLLAAQDLGADAKRIGQLMDEYAKTEPGEEYNELHSIIGSELRTLNPELEAYYERYFTDRGALVALAEQYQGVFNELQSRQDGLVAELNQLADSIESDSADYKRELRSLESDISAFNRRASSGSMTHGEYETGRASLESRQASMQREYTAIQNMIDTYETKRAELAAINSESETLNRSINSSLAPVPGGING